MDMRLFHAINAIAVSYMLCAAGVDAKDAPEHFQQIAQDASLRAATVVEGRDGWLFFMPELRHLGAGKFWGDEAFLISRATREDATDPLPAILAFHNELQARDVKLIIAPVPPKAVIYGDKLPGSTDWFDARPDPWHQTFYDLLRDEGITVLDLTDAFLDARDHERGPLYCLQDTHWSGVACVLAAKAMAEQIKPLVQDVETRSIDTEWRTIEITGDLWRMLDQPALPREELSVRHVMGADPDPESPVLLLGDSHTLVFQAGGDMHYRNAGLADQLAVELGFPVDLIGVRGSGATPARINLFRRAQRNPAYWDDKKVVVWVFAAREFTESDGWRIVPIAP